MPHRNACHGPGSISATELSLSRPVYRQQQQAAVLAMRGAAHTTHHTQGSSSSSNQQQQGAETPHAAAVATVPDAGGEELAVAAVAQHVQQLQQALHLSDEQLSGQHSSR
jgi:hypothetical protein